VEYVHLDVTSPDQWHAVVERAVTTTGHVDVLVNNAGIVHVAPLVEESLSEWNATFAVNATGPFLGIQAVTPALKSNGGGSIINIASTYGVVGCENYASYCASKSALLGLTRVAAIELAPESIRVNAICPGGVNTAQNANGARAKTVEMTPMGRRGHVSEVSGAIAYLACDDSTFTTGAIIPVDGGYLTQ
jgi:NAD(P)-dependent dehydrogenase (short-subunit alcohol dehydrogenase family)